MKLILKSFLALLITLSATAQNNTSCYWQQKVDYKMNIDMDVSHRQVIQAMDQLREIGISNFSMATEESD